MMAYPVLTAGYKQDNMKWSNQDQIYHVELHVSHSYRVLKRIWKVGEPHLTLHLLYASSSDYTGVHCFKYIVGSATAAKSFRILLPSSRSSIATVALPIFSDTFFTVVDIKCCIATAIRALFRISVPVTRNCSKQNSRLLPPLHFLTPIRGSWSKWLEISTNKPLLL